MNATLHVRNLRALRHARFSPRGVQALVGPNGSGKTTLLLVLKMLRAAYDRGLPEAADLALGGAFNLVSAGADEDERVEIEVELDDLRWALGLRDRGARVDHLSPESLLQGEKALFVRDALGNMQLLGESVDPVDTLGLRQLVLTHPKATGAPRLVDWLQGLTVFHDPDFKTVRGGGDLRADRHLHSRGTNLVTILRKWLDQRTDAPRLDFVKRFMRAALTPDVFDDIDFETSGTTVNARVYRAGHELPLPLANEANGVLSMLMSLTAIASADRGVVCIDEPENGLHPHAIRVLVEAARAWCLRKPDVSVLFPTHSPVLLDTFRAEPHQVLVMHDEGEGMPVSLTECRTAEWLADFGLGDLYAQGDFGAPDLR